MRLTRRTLSLASAGLFLLSLTGQVRSQAVLGEREIDAIERDNVALLLKEDLNKVIDKLANERPTTIQGLRRQLSLYSRAGRPDGVRRTLEQLEIASDWESAKRSPAVILKVRSSLIDFAMWRFYFEHLCPWDSENAEYFVRLWEKEGDVKELDSWLAVRSRGDDEWFNIRLRRRVKLGTAGELLEPLATAVRANPQDFRAIGRYLHANDVAQNLQDVSWLADICLFPGAYENFELARMLNYKSSAATARILEKSLSLPFTERDAESVRSALSVRMGLPPNLNYEKQLRFWTRQLLAETYQQLKRPQDAQPLIEQLVTMKGPDIIEENVHQLAGGVQAQSGKRVVEARILREEATRQKTLAYWLERASYYNGRSEYRLQVEAYQKGLAALPNDPASDDVQGSRLELVRSFSYFVENCDDEEPQWRVPLEKVLRNEFKTARPESNYAYWLAEIISDDDLELNELRHKLLASQPELVARILGARKDWTNDEQHLITGIIRGDEVSASEKEAIWNALEKLVADPGSSRANYLAEAMADDEAWDRALRLWLAYLKSDKTDQYISRGKIVRRVIDGFCQRGKWQAAEEFLFKNLDESWKSLEQNLGMVAASAAQQGATNDAMRLWRLKANLDRRDLTGLKELVRTTAKSQLRDFYSQMGKDDPQTTMAQLALASLQ